jgi:hypothetical protein
MFAETMRITWVESDEPLVSPGHGVDFFHEDLRDNEIVASIGGFEGWYHEGGQAKVRFLRTCPDPSIDSGHWAEIVRSTRDALLNILLDRNQLDTYLRGRHASDRLTGSSAVYIRVGA